jgi:hydrogenase expression/formation protein HypD
MSDALRQATEEIRSLAGRCGRPIQLMEVCGTHTVSIFRSGIKSMLPANVRLISGPGCPVCVTAQRHIDAAIRLTQIDDVVLTTYGDMLRVPGKLGSLEQQRARGADVRVVYSARGAVSLAESNPDKTVVFIAIGFETTAPATAAVIVEAERRGLENFCVLPAHKLVVPAMTALLSAGDVPLDGFLCPGHVSVVIGANAYRPVVGRYHKPCVVAGFEPAQIMLGILYLVRQITAGRCLLENVYGVAVSNEGNRVAQALMDQVFEPAAAPWRAIGVIPASGLELRPAYRRFDALRRFKVELGEDEDHPACRCGEVIQGKVTPDQCPLFAHGCTPLHPIGPCMVSSEGTCAAWYKYNRHVVPGAPASEAVGGAMGR